MIWGPWMWDFGIRRRDIVEDNIGLREIQQLWISHKEARA